MEATIYGVGINDVALPAAINKVKNPYYSRWYSMLERCYSGKALAHYSTYITCTVHPDWHKLSAFKSWMQKQAWQNKCLDKDLILPGNSVYSADLCCFISTQLNTLLLDCGSVKGKFPTGVTYHPPSGKYQSRISIEGKRKNLGLWSTPEIAYKIYCNAKADHILTFAHKETDLRIKNGLLLCADKFHFLGEFK